MGVPRVSAWVAGSRGGPAGPASRVAASVGADGARPRLPTRGPPWVARAGQFTARSGRGRRPGGMGFRGRGGDAVGPRGSGCSRPGTRSGEGVQAGECDGSLLGYRIPGRGGTGAGAPSARSWAPWARPRPAGRGAVAAESRPARGRRNSGAALERGPARGARGVLAWGRGLRLRPPRRPRPSPATESRGPRARAQLGGASLHVVARQSLKEAEALRRAVGRAGRGSWGPEALRFFLSGSLFCGVQGTGSRSPGAWVLLPSLFFFGCSHSREAERAAVPGAGSAVEFISLVIFIACESIRKCFSSSLLAMCGIDVVPRQSLKEAEALQGALGRAGPGSWGAGSSRSFFGVPDHWGSGDRIQEPRGLGALVQCHWLRMQPLVGGGARRCFTCRLRG